MYADISMRIGLMEKRTLIKMKFRFRLPSKVTQSFCPSIYLSYSTLNLSIYLSLFLSIYLFMYLSVYLCTCCIFSKSRHGLCLAARGLGVLLCFLWGDLVSPSISSSPSSLTPSKKIYLNEYMIYVDSYIDSGKFVVNSAC